MQVDIKELERLHSRATPGAWWPQGHVEDYWDYTSDMPEQRDVYDGKVFAEPQEEGDESNEVELDDTDNLLLICEMRNSLPAIINELKAARELVSDIEDADHKFTDNLSFDEQIYAAVSKFRESSGDVPLESSKSN